MRFPIIIISYIAVEIVFLIAIGQSIGIIATLLWMGLSAVLGVSLIRISGGEILNSLGTLQENGRFMRNQQNIANILSGVLLIIPGFFSDFLAILIFLPLFRNIFVAILFARASTIQTQSQFYSADQNAHQSEPNTSPYKNTIEGEILDDNLGNRR